MTPEEEAIAAAVTAKLTGVRYEARHYLFGWRVWDLVERRWYESRREYDEQRMAQFEADMLNAGCPF